MTKVSEDYSGARVRLARCFAGLTLGELGHRIGGVSAQYVHNLENGVKTPTPHLLDAIGQVCGFEPRFFFGPQLVEFRDEECHFRRRQSTPVSVRNRMLAHGTIFGQLVAYFDANLSLPPLNVPSLPTRTSEDIERAAEWCRSEWDLGHDRPIASMVRTLENAGVVVTSFAGAAEKVDAFSRSPGRAVVVLNSDKDSTSRSRFDSAHELAHLVMHRGMVTGDEQSERQADAFASAFLLPRVGVVREFPRGRALDWPRIRAFKKRWGASLAATLRRAYDLQLIDAAEYQRGYKYLSAKGWRKNEPDEPPREPPEIVPMCIERMRKKGVSTRELAGTFGWRRETFARVVGIEIEDQPPEVPLPDKVVQLRPRARA